MHQDLPMPPPPSRKRHYNSIGYFDNESGRSLTEMMGTLAIMGILAVAGIWMYHSAMDRLKANTIINEAQKRAVVVAGQIGFQGRTDPSLGEFSDNEFAGGTFSTDVITDGLYQQFGIQVSNVPKSVCQNILNAIGEPPPMRRLTPPGAPTIPITTCGDNNTFLMIYNNDMSTGGSDMGYCDNSACQTVCGQCVVENGENKCVNECLANVGGQCSSNQDCSGECVGCVIPQGETQGTCQACTRVTYLESTGTQYIDTQVPPGNINYLSINTKLQSTYKKDSTIWPFGIINGNGSIGVDFQWSFVRSSSSVGAYRYTLGSNGTVETLDTISSNNTVNITVFGKNTEVNGIMYTHPTILSPENHTDSIYLFGWHRTDGHTQFSLSPLKIYYFKIHQNNTLARDFVPVHAPFQPVGKQNCMYDRVSQTLFCNEADGDDFIIPQ